MLILYVELFNSLFSLDDELNAVQSQSVIIYFCVSDVYGEPPKKITAKTSHFVWN